MLSHDVMPELYSLLRIKYFFLEVFLVFGDLVTQPLLSHGNGSFAK